MIVALVAIAVLAGGFAVCRMTGGDDKIAVDPNAPEPKANLICEACNKSTEMTMDEYEALETNDMGAYQCPKCKKWEAYYRRAGGGSLALPAGGG